MWVRIYNAKNAQRLWLYRTHNKTISETAQQTAKWSEDAYLLDLQNVYVFCIIEGEGANSIGNWPVLGNKCIMQHRRV